MFMDSFGDAMYNEFTKVQNPHKLAKIGWVVSRTDENFVLTKTGNGQK